MPYSVHIHVATNKPFLALFASGASYLSEDQAKFPVGEGELHVQFANMSIPQSCIQV